MYNNMPTLSSKSSNQVSELLKMQLSCWEFPFFLLKFYLFPLKPVQTLEQEKGFVQLFTFSKNE